MIAERDEKISQASEYVTFQRTQIDELTAETEELRGQLDGAGGGHKGEQRRGDERRQLQGGVVSGSGLVSGLVSGLELGLGSLKPTIT